MLRENEAIGWHPEHIKHGRFGDWLEHNVDWALSRDRFWGTPIPVWRCGDCSHDACVGSVAELSELAGRPLTDLDLHRPYVDDVVVACPECGGESHRVDPVLDAWFDSGAMPSSQFHYPVENTELFERRFPADFICEAIDQTRGWFYSLLAVNTLVFGRSPYRNVVCLAHVVDQDGQKMSKSKGNVIDPWTILDSRGADALRWYFFSAGSPWTAPARERLRHRRIDPPVPPHALEHVLLLRHVREPRRLDPRRNCERRALHECAGSVDPVAGQHHRARGHRRARRLRRVPRRASARTPRRRPLQLVRAPVPAPILEGCRPRRARDPARRAAHSHAAAGAVLSVRRRRDLLESDGQYRVGPSGRLAHRRRVRHRLHPRSADGRGSPGGHARSRRARGGQAQGAPTAATRVRAGAWGHVVGRGAAGDRRRAQREGGRSRLRSRRPARRRGGAQLPCARASASVRGCRW